MRRGGALLRPYVIQYENINSHCWRHPRHRPHYPHRLCHTWRIEHILHCAHERNILPTCYRLASARSLVWTLSTGNYIQLKTTLAARVDNALRRAAGGYPARIYPQCRDHPDICRCPRRDIRVGNGCVEADLFSLEPQVPLNLFLLSSFFFTFPTVIES